MEYKYCQMNKNDIQQVIKNREVYDRLRAKGLDLSKVGFLCFGGSKSYKLDSETSDEDIRGFRFEGVSSLLGLESSKNETYTDEKDGKDAIIFTFKNFVVALMKGNPNVLELLGVAEEDIIVTSPVYEELRDKANLFLGKHLYHHYKGYAYQQRTKAIKLSDDLVTLLRFENEETGEMQETTVFQAKYKKMCKLISHNIRVLNQGARVFNGEGIVTVTEGAENALLRCIKYQNIVPYDIMTDSNALRFMNTALEKFESAYERTGLSDDIDITWLNDFIIRVHLQCLEG